MSVTYDGDLSNRQATWIYSAGVDSLPNRGIKTNDAAQKKF